MNKIICKYRILCYFAEYSVILPNILLVWCRIFVFCLTWKILFRSYPTMPASDFPFAPLEHYAYIISPFLTRIRMETTFSFILGKVRPVIWDPHFAFDVCLRSATYDVARRTCEYTQLRIFLSMRLHESRLLAPLSPPAPVSCKLEVANLHFILA